MRTKFTLVAIVVCALIIVTIARPKKKNKDNSARHTAKKKVAEPNYSVDENKVVRNANKEVVGKLDVEGKIINKDGKVVGSIPEYSAPNVQEVYSNY